MSEEQKPITEDIERNCVECHNPFIITIRDQQFIKEMGWGLYIRCYHCRKAKKLRSEGRVDNRPFQGIDEKFRSPKYAPEE